MNNSSAISGKVSMLFWDVDPSTLDLEFQKDFIIERVLSMGDEEALKWLWKKYGPQTICVTVSNSRRLTVKTARCWQNYFDLKEEQMRCFSTYSANLDSIY